MYCVMPDLLIAVTAIQKTFPQCLPATFACFTDKNKATEKHSHFY